jgi:septum site-determining protein MinC
MSAVLCSDVSPVRLELRSAALTLMAVVLKTTDLALLADELAQRAEATPGLFDDEPVVLDLSGVRDADDAEDALAFDALLALLRRHGLRPVAVRGGDAGQTAAALAAGLFDVPEGTRAPREAPQVVERIVERRLPALPPLVIDKPLRSGQQVYAQDRDLIVLALVSHGAEVMADGHVHVYAPLRGRAHAGKGGNTDARIFCQRMEAQVLAIAGVHRTTDGPLPAGVAFGNAAMVRLAVGQIVIEPLG